MDVADAIEAGLLAEDAGDFVGAVAAYSSLTDHPDPRTVAEVKAHLARVAFKQNQLDASLGLCEEVRSYALRVGDRDLRARIENSIGAIHAARGEYTQAKSAYIVALELTQDKVTRGKISLNLGVIANIQGMLDVARRHYSQSLALCREADDDRGEALALHNIGMLCADMQEWEEADEAFRDALTLLEAQGNRQMIALLLQNRSEVSIGRGRPQEAIAQCDLAIATFAEIGDELGRGEALRWKGHALRLVGKHGSALAALNETVRIAQRTRTKLLEAEATRELAYVYKADNRPREARNAFTRALDMFVALGAELDAAKLRSEIAAFPPD